MNYKLFLLVVIFLCSPIYAESPKEYATQLIKAKAKNCGDLGYQKDANKINACIREHMLSLENFYAWFWFKAGETTPATGLAMADGILYITWFDRVGKGKETYFQSFLCDRWDYQPTAPKPIICTMKKPKTKVHLFELENLVELQLLK